MPYYYDNITAEKKGPFRHHEIKDLAANGTISLETMIELVDGRIVKAKEIPELKCIFEEHTPNTAAPPPLPQQIFCTYCGHQVTSQSVVCVSCGANSAGHRNYCRSCGAQLNAQQVVCIKCGTAIESDFKKRGKQILDTITNGVFSNVRQATTGEQMNRLTYIYLAVMLGGFGMHDFYAKRYKSALLHIGLIVPVISILIAFCFCVLFPELLIDIVKPEHLMEGKPPVSGITLLLLRLSTPLYIISYIWALVDIPLVKNDGDGLPMKE
jgi:hypothetical protein